MKRILCLLLLLGMLICLSAGCDGGRPAGRKSGTFSAGFGVATLSLPDKKEGPLYVAGYHNGREITGVLDLQQARALWLDDGDRGILLIAVDCVGLGSDTVAEIRSRLKDFCRETGCDSVNVVSTHTHAGIDTLGLWGPVGLDGKNPAFMEILTEGAVSAARAAYADRTTGSLQYSTAAAEGLQEDSRSPSLYDDRLYRLRFLPDEEGRPGIRLICFGAHAESLRGENTLVSRDYPGVMCDRIKEQTGDNALFLPGAVGGLIKTPELTEGPFDPVENLRLTGEAVAACALSEAAERPLAPSLSANRMEVEVPLDNTLFIYYKFLGVLGNEVRQTGFGGYRLVSELTALRIGDLTLALFPGELFPELVFGTGREEDPAPLNEIAQRAGVSDLVIVGLANDEIGYLIPPSDFLTDPELPYLREAEGNHYEETNSPGKGAAAALAEAFARLLGE